MNITSTIEKLKDNTIKLSITIPSDLVKKTWEKVVEETSKNTKLSGFRKGKAPKKLVEENIDAEKVREEVLKELLPQAYIEAVKQHNITPIVNPKIHVEKFGEGENWEFTALTCDVPEIQLNNYKDEVKKITAKSKIVIPGKENQQVNFDDIVKTLLEHTTATIPGMLTEHEVDRLLSQTLDEVKRLGMTLEQYLNATKRNPQNLREEYQKKAEIDIKLEFVLQKIAEVEKIAVDEKEIEEAIQKAKDDNERKNLEANKYLLASILRQQKTLDFLRNL